MTTHRRLYVLDPSQDLADVLNAVLGQQGTEVTSVESVEQISYPAVDSGQSIVLMNARVPMNSFLNQLPYPRIVIGQNHKAKQAEEAQNETVPECRIDELFEYPDLFRAIETMWNRVA